VVCIGDVPSIRARLPAWVWVRCRDDPLFDHQGGESGSCEGQRDGFLVFVMTALVSPGFGWWMQKLAGGTALTLDVYDIAGSIYVAAIVVAAILTLFLKKPGLLFGRRIDASQRDGLLGTLVN
jgi:hypothetical protein